MTDLAPTWRGACAFPAGSRADMSDSVEGDVRRLLGTLDTVLA